MPLNKKYIIAVVIAAVSYYFYFRNFFDFYISMQIDIHMILFVILWYYIYLVIKFIFDREITEKEKHTFLFMYIIMLITLFFSKDINSSSGYVNTFNLDVRRLIDDFNFSNVGYIVFIMNVFLIIPLGWMCRKIDLFIKLLLPLFIFLVVEYTQYVNQVGIFDINDIILNTFGFYIGSFLLPKIIKK